MAFIWNPNPNSTTPPPILPVPVGDGEMSYEAKEVANSVNVDPIYGVGTLLWNIATPDADGDSDGDFDIIYQLPSLNVKDIHVTHLEADNVTVYFNATINTANIGVATINTANIVNATIANGRMGVNPTANLQIATKEYVDALAANSIPLGGNLQLLIQAAGDLLVGVSDNTAERLPVGTTDGQVLVSGGSSNTGVYWASHSTGASTGTFKGLYIGTHREGKRRNTEVQLVSVDSIVMDDGIRVTSGWNGLLASHISNVATSGVGYLDTGVATPNACYEVWAVRNSSTGAQGLILHRAIDRREDSNNCLATGGVGGGVRSLRRSDATHAINVSKCAQAFTVTRSGPLLAIELGLVKKGNPLGNVWITIESTDAQGNADGIVLATSRYKDCNRLANVAFTGARVRMPFDITANLVAGNVYQCVVQADYPFSGPATNPPSYVVLSGFISGSLAPRRGKNFNITTNGWAFANSGQPADTPPGPAYFYIKTTIETNSSPLVMPSGYDQKCLLSYAVLNDDLIFRPYSQRQRTMSMPFHYHWDLPFAINFDVGFSNYQVPLDMGEFVPPVPCLVRVAQYPAGTSPVCAGHMDTCDLGGESPSIVIDYESVGAVYANGVNGGVICTPPILCELGAIQVRQGAGYEHLMEVEF